MDCPTSAGTVLISMPETPADHGRSGADIISASAALSNEELRARLDEGFRQIAAAIGRVVVDLGELDRRQAFRDEGATSTEAWAVERFGVAPSTARALTRLGEKAWDIPQLLGSLCAGEMSFDKMRAVAEVATPETDRQLRDQAKAALGARAGGGRPHDRADPTPADAKSDHDRRFLRFNDQFRTVTAQLPAESYAETKTCLEARARQVPTDGETPWDQRLCDGFFELIRSSTLGGSGEAATSSPQLRRRPRPTRGTRRRRGRSHRARRRARAGRPDR